MLHSIALDVSRLLVRSRVGALSADEAAETERKEAWFRDRLFHQGPAEFPEPSDIRPLLFQTEPEAASLAAACAETEDEGFTYAVRHTPLGYAVEATDCDGEERVLL